MEAFADRGHGDFLASHDLEDITTIVDGRSELADEAAVAAATSRLDDDDNGDGDGDGDG